MKKFENLRARISRPHNYPNNEQPFRLSTITRSDIDCNHKIDVVDLNGIINIILGIK